MTWSNQKPPGLDDIFDRFDSPHAIAGDALAVVDSNAHETLSAALTGMTQATSALYIHIPFCPSRCLSCDHLTIVEHDQKAMDRYLKTLHDELALMSAKAGKAICINRIHIGGGSPNYLDDVQLAGLMASVHSAFAVTCDAEISMEINPRRTSRSQLDLLQGLGVRHLHLEVRQHSSMLDAMVLDHERATGQWHVEWSALPNSFIIASSSFRSARCLLEGLEISPDNMKKNINQTKGLIVAEAVMMALAPHIGRQVAHDLVYDCCRKSIKNNIPFIDTLLSENDISKIFNKNELLDIINPKNYLGAAPAMASRLLKNR